VAAAPENGRGRERAKLRVGWGGKLKLEGILSLGGIVPWKTEYDTGNARVREKLIMHSRGGGCLIAERISRQETLKGGRKRDKGRATIKPGRPRAERKDDPYLLLKGQLQGGGKYKFADQEGVGKLSTLNCGDGEGKKEKAGMAEGGPGTIQQPLQLRQVRKGRSGR